MRQLHDAPTAFRAATTAPERQNKIAQAATQPSTSSRTSVGSDVHWAAIEMRQTINAMDATPRVRVARDRVPLSAILVLRPTT